MTLWRLINLLATKYFLFQSCPHYTSFPDPRDEICVSRVPAGSDCLYNLGYHRCPLRLLRVDSLPETYEMYEHKRKHMQMCLNTAFPAAFSDALI